MKKSSPLLTSSSSKLTLMSALQKMSTPELLKEVVLRQKSISSQTRGYSVTDDLELHQLNLEIQSRALAEAHRVAQASLAQYQEIFELAPISYLLLDEKGKILEINGRSLLLLQTPWEDLRGRHFSRWINPNSKPSFALHLKMCAETEGAPVHCEVVIQAGPEKETKFLQLSSFRTLDPATGKPIIRMSLTDVTEKKRINFLAVVAKDLIDEKGLRERFVCTLYHDLRAPLTSSKLCTQMLMLQIKEHLSIPKTKRLFEILSEELERADRMIRELLDANKIKNGDTLPLLKKKCCMDKIARKSLEVLTQTQKTTTQFKYKSSGDVKGVWSPDGVHRILENLIGNAIKYGSQDKPISVSVGDKGTHVSVSVHNYGNPIDSKDQRKIFEAFHRTGAANASTASGWGLGLNLVNTLVQRHGGEIKLKSNLVDGTCFEFLLPKKKAT